MSLIPTRSTASRRRLMLVAVTAGVLSAALAACSSQPAAVPTTAPSVDHSEPVDSLSVITPNADPSTVTNLFLANALGYFDDANADIEIINGAGAAGASLLVSGEADLLLSSATIGFPLAAQGQPISLVFSDVGGGLGAGLSVAEESSYEDLEDLSGKKVGTIGTTGGTYGFANLLSQTVVDDGGEPFEIVAFNDATTMLNALVSGQVDAVSASAGTVATLVAEGKVRNIIDTTDLDQRQEYIGSDYTIDTGYAGLRENLDAKRESVVRFLEALTRADEYRTSHTPEEIATILAKDELFAALSVEQITQSVEARMPFYTPDGGEISETAWDETLSWFTRWDIPTLGDVAADPTFSYDEVVDMSYLTEAQERLAAH